MFTGTGGRAGRGANGLVYLPTPYVSQQVCGRLTTESGVPVSTSDRTAQATIYWTPTQGDSVPLFDPSSGLWRRLAFSETSLALSGLTSGKNYDVFVYNNSGTLALELSAAWTDDTTRADAVSLRNGLYVKTSATTRLWVGAIRTTATTTTEDSLLKRFVWNAYNQVQRLSAFSLASTHTYGTQTWRYWNNASTSKVEFVVGSATSWVDVGIVSAASSSGLGAAAGALVNWTSGDPGAGNSIQNNGAYVRHGNRNVQSPALGYNYVAFLEWGEGGTVNFYEMYGRCTLLS